MCMCVEDLADTGGREGARGYHKIGKEMGDRVGCSAKREREREVWGPMCFAWSGCLFRGRWEEEGGFLVWVNDIAGKSRELMGVCCQEGWCEKIQRIPLESDWIQIDTIDIAKHVTKVKTLAYDTLQRSFDAYIPIRLDVTLVSFKSSRLFDDRDAHSFRFNLPDGSGKPLARPQEPAAKSP